MQQILSKTPIWLRLIASVAPILVVYYFATHNAASTVTLALVLLGFAVILFGGRALYRRRQRHN